MTCLDVPTFVIVFVVLAVVAAPARKHRSQHFPLLLQGHCTRQGGLRALATAHVSRWIILQFTITHVSHFVRMPYGACQSALPLQSMIMMCPSLISRPPQILDEWAQTSIWILTTTKYRTKSRRQLLNSIISLENCETRSLTSQFVEGALSSQVLLFFSSF